MDYRRAVLVLRHWWPVLVAGALLAAGAGYLVGKTQPRLYAATATLQVNPGLGTYGGGNDFNEVQSSWAQATEDARLVAGAGVVLDAINRVGGQLRLPADRDVTTVVANTTAAPVPQTALVNVTVQSRDPQDAGILANAIAAAFVARDERSRSTRYAATLARLDVQIKALSADEATARTAAPTVRYARISADEFALNGLQQDASSIRLRQYGVGASVQVAGTAPPLGSLGKSRTLVNTLVAALLALLALLALAFLADYLDDRPRTADDVAAALGLPLLGTLGPAVPGHSDLAALDDPASPRADEYRLLRANLGLNVAARTRTGTAMAAQAPRLLALSGVQPGDGTTTAAANLAVAVARAGMRVVLVDANLRRPALHALFGLATGAGLATLLRDGGDPTASLQATRLPHLRLLAAGSDPADALDLLGSMRMRSVLAAIGEEADLVIVDAGATEQPDAAMLVPLADAAVVIARLPTATRAVLTAAAQHLGLAGAAGSGVVVTLFTGAMTARPAARPSPTAEPVDVERTPRTDPRPAK